MIKFFGLIFLIFLLSGVSAECNSTQVDINSADANNLDRLSGIGTVKALAIIQMRPFNSVDDLIKVMGIGNATLAKIKLQGLACIGEIQNDTQKNISQTAVFENISVQKTNPTDNQIVINSINENATKKQEIINLTPIILDTKNIKTENNSEILKRNLSFYGLIAISAIAGALILIKGRKRKNEFN